MQKDAKKSEHDKFLFRRIQLAMGVAVICLIVISFFIYSRNLNNTLQQDSLDRFVELADYNGTVVRGGLEDKERTLKSIAKYVESSPSKINDETIRVFQQNDNIERIGIIDPNGNIKMLDDLGTYTLNVYRQPLFSKGLQGKESITKIGDDLIFSIPLNRNDKIEGILFASYKAVDLNTLINTADLKALTSNGIFDGKGYSVIMDKKGNKILDSSNAVKIEMESGNAFVNLLKFDNTNKSKVDILQQEMQQNKAGMMIFKGPGNVYFRYQPLFVDELYLVTVIPEEALTDKYNALMISTYLLFFCMFVLMIFIIAVIVKKERKKQTELRYLVEVDELTGGYSFEKFSVEAKKMLQRPEKIACITLDIDNFKLINTLFGYKVGNKILKAVWQVIEEHVAGRGIHTKRYADIYDILVKYTYKQDLEVLAEQIIKGVMRLNIINKDKFRVIPSMGIYIIKDKNEDIKSILNCAAIARNSTKNKYDKHYTFYVNNLQNNIIEKKYTIDKIARALRHREFYPYFQGQFDAENKTLIGAEALIRWIRTDGTIVSPAKFIPIAEEVGSIIDIDRYMFIAVCKWQNYWRAQNKEIVPISVNISRASLYRPNIIQEYKTILRQYNLSEKYIQIEITEGILCDELSVSGKIVDELRAAGFGVLIDDFGVGYSSISMVKDIGATELKIDKSFIDDMSPKGQEMIKQVIRLSQTMCMKTVAEGVETKEQYEFLRENHCDIIQGYYFAKPLPSDEFVKLLKEKR